MMNKTIHDMIETRLTQIFQAYPTTPALRKLKIQLQATLLAAATAYQQTGMADQAASDQAFRDAGDLTALIHQALVHPIPDYHGTWQHHRLDADGTGLRIDQGRVLNVNARGISINQGRTFRADERGLKLGRWFFGADGTTMTQSTAAATGPTPATDEPTQVSSPADQAALAGHDLVMLPIAGLHRIAITATRATVKLLPTTGDQVIVRQTMTHDSPADQARVRRTKDTLRIIQVTGPDVLRFRITLVVLIPESFTGVLQVHNQRGKLFIDQLVGLQALKLTVDRGILHLTRAQATNAVLTVTAGVIHLTDLTTAHFDITAHSGTIRATALSGAGRITNQAGTVATTLRRVTGDLTFEDLTGTLQTTLPPHDAYTFDLEAGRGTVSLQAPVTHYDHNVLGLKTGVVGDSPAYHLQMRTQTGTIHVD